MNSRMQPHNLWGLLRSHLHHPNSSLDACWSILSTLDDRSRRRASTYALSSWAHQPELSFGRVANLSHLLDIASWSHPLEHDWDNLVQPVWTMRASELASQNILPSRLSVKALTSWRHDLIREICRALPRWYAQSPDLPKIRARAKGMLLDLELARALLRQGCEARHPVCYHLGGEQLRGHLWSLRGEMYQVEHLLDLMLPRLGRQLPPGDLPSEVRCFRWRLERLQSTTLLAWLERSLARTLVRASASP